MGWVQEIADLVKKVEFCTIVYEYEQGLKYSRRGVAIETGIRWPESKLEEIAAGEKRVTKELGGYLSLMLRLKNPQMPEGYRKRAILGLPRSSARDQKAKVLNSGLYFHWPIIEHIVTRSQQEKVLNLGNITVLTTDTKNITLSCNIRYRLRDLYLAYTAVHDYEVSLKDHTISILGIHADGKALDDWKKPEIKKEVEKQVEEELRKVATKKWGLEIIKVYITDRAQTYLQRVLYEGPPLAMDQGRAGTAIPMVFPE